jgi:hypothetical protein
MLIISLFACAGAPVDLSGTTAEGEVVDLRVTDEELGELGPDQLVLDGPEVVVEPGTDVMICLFGTYTGPDVGLHDVHTFQARYGHHVQLMGTTTPALDAPDGTVVDCTGESGDFEMADLEPIGVTNGGTVDGDAIDIAMPLPPGMAVELESGQRYVVQSHYLNSGPDPIRVRDRAVLTTIPADQVETWAAPLIFNRDDFRIPAGGTLTTSFSCTVDADVSLVYLLGHMHEWGTSFQIDQVDGTTRTPFYAVPEWDPVYRDAPIVLSAVDDPVDIAAGTTFETTCSWANGTDEDLVFPHEMCVSVAFVYPQKTTLICDGNGQ